MTVVRPGAGSSQLGGGPGGHARPARMRGAAVLFPAALLGLAGCMSTGILPPAGVAPQARVMEVTAYCNCGTCCGWERAWFGLGRPVVAYGPSRGKAKQVGVTASGTRAREGTVAADLSRYPFGTVVYVPGYGYGCVEDTGGAIRGERLDLWFGSHDEALAWGRRRLVVTVWPRRGGMLAGGEE